MATFGTDNRQGVGVRFSMDFNGTTNRFSDEIISVSDLSNSGDTIDSKRKISDLSWSLYDGSGTIWDELGHGTEAFGLPISLKVSIGGSYGLSESPNGTKVEFQGTQGGVDYNVHEGSLVYVSRQNRLIQLRSENKLNKIKYMNWQMPIRNKISSGVFDSAGNTLNRAYGSYVFYLNEDATLEGRWNDYIQPYCAFNLSENGRGFDMYAHTAEDVVNWNGFNGTGIYDTSSAGVTDFLADNFNFVDTNYHSLNPAKKFKGTYFGTLIGTINTEEDAKKYGYADVAEAETERVPIGPSSSTGTYTLNRMRFEYGTEFNSAETRMWEAQPIQLTGDPVAVMRHCLFGKMVTDYLDESTDKGDSFDRSQQILGVQVFDQKIDPDEQKIEGFVNDALQMTSSIFFVNTSNQFEMAAYGPINLQENLDTYGTNEILSSKYSNNINDYYNKITLNYGWDFDSEKYVKQIVGTQDDWSILNERVLEIDTKWVKNDNQANNFVAKLLTRYKRTSPEMTVELGLNAAGRELGSLISLEDPDSWTGTKIAQIVEYNKSFGESRKVRLRCLDGDALFRKRGYAVWEDSAAGPDVTATTVDNDSRSGWSDGAGTVNNINTDDYGDYFTWWQ